MQPKQNCSLCYSKLENEWGNNPFPLLKKDGDRCCDRCNERYVIPTRRGFMTDDLRAKYVSNVINAMDKIYKSKN